MNNIKYSSNINFIFYIPGSMGSLLSTLIKSQIEEDFNFVGFADNTAHLYACDAFYNTHSHADYLNFKKSNTNLEEHLIKNIKNNNSDIQRCDINWCQYFKNKKVNSFISYIDDHQLKLENLYVKLNKVISDNFHSNEINFTINKNNKNYKKIMFIKTICWYINQEKKYLKVFPRLNLLNLIQKKNFIELEKICKITDKKKLDIIIDDYNNKQIKSKSNFPEFSPFITKYLKKYS